MGADPQPLRNIANGISSFCDLPDCINLEIFCESRMAHVDLLVLIFREQGVYKSWGYSVCTTWLIKKNHSYLVDLQRKKLDHPDLKALAIGLARQYQPRVVLIVVLIEGTGVGTGQLAELKEHDIDAVAVTRKLQRGTSICPVSQIRNRPCVVSAFHALAVGTQGRVSCIPRITA